MKTVRFAMFAAVVWGLQATAVAQQAFSVTRTLPAPAPLTTGSGLPIRWLVVGMSAGLCLLLLSCAVVLAARARSADRDPAESSSQRR